MTGIVEWNPLLASPSPRDMQEILDAHHVLGEKYERVYAKYLVESSAYKLLRWYFLEHPEYTHLVLCPDDLLIKPEDLDALYNDLIEIDYPILSGICNVDMEGNKDKYSITENLPHPMRSLSNVLAGARDWGWRWYAWYTMGEIKKEQSRQYRTIIKVPHSGFACQIIRRDVVKDIEFKTDARYNELPVEHETASTDVMFSNFCAAAKIPIFADPRVNMLHIRKEGLVTITVNVTDVTDGELRFYPKGSKEYKIIPYDRKMLSRQSVEPKKTAEAGDGGLQK